MKCDKCKKEFTSGNRADGTPNGVGFGLQDGRVITLCAACIMKHENMKELKDTIEGMVSGSLDEKGKDTFFRGLGY